MNKAFLKKSLRGFALILSLAGYLAAATGCAQKRPESIAQGQGVGLVRIQDLDGKMYELVTGDAIDLGNVTSAEERINIGNDVPEMNALPLVEFMTTEPDVQMNVRGLPFRGVPNSASKKGVSYSVLYKVSDKFLKIYKVGQKENFPFQDHSFIEMTLEDGRVAIPMAGFPISYVKLDKVKNSLGEQTHELSEFPVESRSQATHARVDGNGRTVFESVVNTDHFPASLFSGDWYYAETIIASSRKNIESVGQNLNQAGESMMELSSRVRFVGRPKTLYILDFSEDERLNRARNQTTGVIKADGIQAGSASDETLEKSSVVWLPIEWKDYKVSVKSELGTEERDVRWDKRQFVKIDFAGLHSIPNPGGEGTRLVDLEVQRDYFGFTLLKMVRIGGRAEPVKVNYSFLRAKSQAKARPSHKDDRGSYGFFTVTKPYIANHEFYTEQDLEKRILISRYNLDPKNGQIKFHLSHNTPVYMEDVAQDAVSAWDDAFKEALGKKADGTPWVALDKSRVQLGDLRYSTINMIDQIGEGRGLLGFGPSVSDPITGEIISATSNIHVESIRAGVVGSIREYIIRNVEKLPGSASQSGVVSLLAGETKKIDDDNDSLKPILDRVLKGEKSAPLASASLDRASVAKRMKEAGWKLRSCSEEQGAGMSNLQREIHERAECSKVREIVAAGSLPETTPVEAIDECAAGMLKQKVLSTLIHEMGHNLGLRHNFMGSTDVKRPNADGELVKKFSSNSIMEYTSFDEDRLATAGEYDIEAIRFGYAGKVKTADGEIVALDPSKSIKQNLAGKKLIPLSFCTDEDAFLETNPMCRRHDVGATPKEVVEWMIKDYESSYPLSHFRRNRHTVTSPAARVVNYTLIPMKRIYDEWRYKLADFMRRRGKYLSGMSAKDYADVLVKMQNDPVHGEQYRQYREAAEIIYTFLRDTAFSPNHYCVVQKGETKSLVEFDRLRVAIYEDSLGKSVVTNCQEASDAGAIKLVMGADYAYADKEIGREVTTYQYRREQRVDMNLNDAIRPDVIGNQTERLYAMVLLNLRDSGSIKNLVQGFVPNFVEEPAWREEIMLLSFGRIINGVEPIRQTFGVQTSPLISSWSGMDGLKPQPLFAVESRLITNFAILFKDGLMALNDQNEVDGHATAMNWAPIDVYVPRQGETLPAGIPTLKVNGTARFVAPSQSAQITAALIQRYNQVGAMLALAPIDPRVGAVLPTWVARMHKKDAQPGPTLNDFLKSYQLLGQVMQAAPTLIDCLMSEYEAQFDAVDKFVEALAPDFQAIPAAERAAFLAKDAQTYIRSKLGPDAQYPFFQENFRGMAETALSCTDEVNAIVEEVQQNKADLKAQQSTIYGTLQGIQ